MEFTPKQIQLLQGMIDDEDTRIRNTDERKMWQKAQLAELAELRGKISGLPTEEKLPSSVVETAYDLSLALEHEAIYDDWNREETLREKVWNLLNEIDIASGFTLSSR